MALILIQSILPSPLYYHSDKNMSTLFREYYFNKFIYHKRRGHLNYKMTSEEHKRKHDSDET